jgi:FixJ family two-component response regulator
MNELQQALSAMSKVDFGNIDPAHQATLGGFLERALDEIVKRETEVSAREAKVNQREADVSVREERVEKQITAVASAERLSKGLGFTESTVFITPPKRSLWALRRG